MANILTVSESVKFTHSGKLKANKWLKNTIEEYRIGTYLQSLDESKPQFTLFVDLVQDNGDFQVGLDTYELKSNRGALSSGYLSFEVFNTDKLEYSGLLKSVIDNVTYFAVYLPTYQTFNFKYKSLRNKLVIFDTGKLYQWITKQEDIEARNTNDWVQNALNYRVPVKYLHDSASFKELIVKEYHIPEKDLEQIKVPNELYTLFYSK